MASVDSLRIVRGACPHDCPDTCAMHVSVDDAGRAVAVKGDPEHPVTAGFLCGKVSNYLDRVYAEDRLLEPLLRDGPKGEARFRPAGWDEALEVAAAGIRRAVDEHGGESLLPYSYMGTQGSLQGNAMSGRMMNALGAQRAGAHDLRHSRHRRHGGGARPLAGGGPRGVGARAAPARVGLEPHEHGAAPVALHARGAPRGARLVVVDPFRSRTARVADEHLRPLPGTDAALALGMMRAVVDAGLHDEEWCRAYANGYDELLERLAEWPIERAASVSGVPEAAIARAGEQFASTKPALLRLGVGAQRHLGAPAAYRTIACLPALTGAWRHRGGGCSYIPTATASAVPDAKLARDDLRPGPVRRVNMSQLGHALTELDPPVAALVVWNSNPAQIAPDQTQGAGRATAR